MEEYPYRASPENATQKMINCERERMSECELDEEDLIECSGKHCTSCVGGAIADCLAISCCPCGVMSILALALVKLPLMVGRKCLRLTKKKAQKKLEEKPKCRRSSESSSTKRETLEKDENLRRVKADHGRYLQNGEEYETYGGSTRLRMEKIWSELFDQIGHIGFGEASFSGVPVST